MIGFVSGGSPDSWAIVRARSADLERGRLVEGRLGAVQALNSMTDDAVSFGRFRFDLRRRELFRDESSVRLGGRALDVMHALAAAKGDVVSKTDLLARVWPGMAVGENNLQVQISLLRKTLQEDTRRKLPSYRPGPRLSTCRPRYARARTGPPGQAFDRRLAFREQER